MHVLLASCWLSRCIALHLRAQFTLRHRLRQPLHGRSAACALNTADWITSAVTRLAPAHHVYVPAVLATCRCTVDSSAYSRCCSVKAVHTNSTKHHITHKAGVHPHCWPAVSPLLQQFCAIRPKHSGRALAGATALAAAGAGAGGLHCAAMALL
jgi:hypothetical protein